MWWRVAKRAGVGACFGSLIIYYDGRHPSDKSVKEDLQVVSGYHPRSTLGNDWQDATSELMIEMDKQGHAVLGMDFAMNHTCVPKEELKQEFWNRTQVSLHPMLTYSEWPPDWNTTCHP